MQVWKTSSWTLQDKVRGGIRAMTVGTSSRPGDTTLSENTHNSSYRKHTTETNPKPNRNVRPHILVAAVAAVITIVGVLLVSIYELQLYSLDTMTPSAASLFDSNATITKANPKLIWHDKPFAEQDNAENDTRWVPFPAQYSESEYEEIMEPARQLEVNSNYDSHSLEKLHSLAVGMDKKRADLPPNAISERMEIPEPVSLEFYQKRYANFLWGSPAFRSDLKEWYGKVCKSESHIDRINMGDTAKSTSEAELVQRSFQLHNVSYDDELHSNIFPEKGQALETPYCDLRNCPQDRFPFIYILIPHRNRISNLVRLVSSVRNATLRCGEPPPWYNCLCLYVSDYATKDKVSLSVQLDNVWKDRIRLLSRSPVTAPWVKGRTYNSALRYIPTPSKRSLVFHIDADLVLTDTSCIDKGLQHSVPGKQVAFPVVMGTRGAIKNVDQFMIQIVNGTLEAKDQSWIRKGGVGMTWFYLYDDNIGLFGKTINKTTWGGEDNAFYAVFYRLGQKKQTKMPARYVDKSLWHIYHKQMYNWKRSKDGISISRGKF